LAAAYINIPRAAFAFPPCSALQNPFFILSYLISLYKVKDHDDVYSRQEIKHSSSSQNLIKIKKQLYDTSEIKKKRSADNTTSCKHRQKNLKKTGLYIQISGEESSLRS
jgi:hypothetical protein